MGKPSPLKGMTRAQIHAQAEAKRAAAGAKRSARKPRKSSTAVIDQQIQRMAVFGGTSTADKRKAAKKARKTTTKTAAKRVRKGPSATSVARKQAAGIKRAGSTAARKTIADARALAKSKPALKTLTVGKQSGLATYAGGTKSKAFTTMRKQDTSGITNAANKRAQAIVGNANKRAQGVVAKAQAKDAKSKHKATHGKRVTTTKRSTKK